MPIETLFDAVGDIADGLLDVAGDLSKSMEQARKRAREEAAKQRRDIMKLADDAGLEDTRWKNNRLYGRAFGASVEWRESSYKPKNSPRQYASHAGWTFQPPLPGSFTFERPGLLDHLSAMFGGKPVPKEPFLWSDNDITTYMRSEEIEQRVRAHAEFNLRMQGGNLLLSRSGRLKKRAKALAAAQPLSDALGQRWRARSAELETLGFKPSGEAGRWFGVLDGAPIEVHETRKKSSYTTFIRSKLERPLPEGTRISRQQKKHRPVKGAQPLGDMMIDTMLVVVSSDIAAVAKRVCHDAARAPLIEVVHGHSRSKVDSNGIVLRRRGPIVGDSGTRLVAELYNALHQPHS